MLFDFAGLSGLDRYKLLVATVVPRPIAWVVTVDEQGTLNAAPYSFFNALSGDPPIVAIGVGARAPRELKDTGRNIRATRQFVVCLVDEANAAAMNVTAVEFPPPVDEVAVAGLTTVASTRVRPPRIAESPVAIECELHTMIDLGPERSIVLGQVLAMHVRDEAVLDAAKCYIDTPKLNLIGRMHGRGWYARTTDRFEMPRIALEEWEARQKAAE